MFYLIYEVCCFLFVGVCVIADIDDKFPDFFPHVIAFGRWLWRWQKGNSPVFLTASEERDHLRAITVRSPRERAISRSRAERQARQDIFDSPEDRRFLRLAIWDK